MTVEKEPALKEIEEQKEYFDKFGARMPAELLKQRDDVKQRTEKAA